VGLGKEGKDGLRVWEDTIYCDSLARWVASNQVWGHGMRTWEKISYLMIHMDIGGHPPFPTGSKQFSDNFGNLLVLAVLTFRAILRA
jgi:hypothetical protein